MAFSKQVISWSLRATKRTAEVHQAVALEGFRILKRRSPVKTGRFRANWRVGLNSPDLTADDSVTKSRFGDEPNANELRAARSVIRKAKIDDDILMTNSLPYAKKLNEGSSTMAPAGIIPLAHAELLALFPGIGRFRTGR